jgi:hypothetical protein
MTGADDFDLAVAGRAIVRLGGPQALARVLRAAVEATTHNEEAGLAAWRQAARSCIGASRRTAPVCGSSDSLLHEVHDLAVVVRDQVGVCARRLGRGRAPWLVINRPDGRMRLQAGSLDVEVRERLVEPPWQPPGSVAE